MEKILSCNLAQDEVASAFKATDDQKGFTVRAIFKSVVNKAVLR